MYISITRTAKRKLQDYKLREYKAPRKSDQDEKEKYSITAGCRKKGASEMKKKKKKNIYMNAAREPEDSEEKYF